MASVDPFRISRNNWILTHKHHPRQGGRMLMGLRRSVAMRHSPRTEEALIFHPIFARVLDPGGVRFTQLQLDHMEAHR